LIKVDEGLFLMVILDFGYHHNYFLIYMCAQMATARDGIIISMTNTNYLLCKSAKRKKNKEKLPNKVSDLIPPPLKYM